MKWIDLSNYNAGLWVGQGDYNNKLLLAIDVATQEGFDLYQEISQTKRFTQIKKEIPGFLWYADQSMETSNIIRRLCPNHSLVDVEKFDVIHPLANCDLIYPFLHLTKLQGSEDIVGFIKEEDALVYLDNFIDTSPIQLSPTKSLSFVGPLVWKKDTSGVVTKQVHPANSEWIGLCAIRWVKDVEKDMLPLLEALSKPYVYDCMDTGVGEAKAWVGFVEKSYLRLQETYENNPLKVKESLSSFEYIDKIIDNEIRSLIVWAKSTASNLDGYAAAAALMKQSDVSVLRNRADELSKVIKSRPIEIKPDEKPIRGLVARRSMMA